MSLLEASFARRLSPSFALEVDLALDLPAEAPVAALFGPSGCGKSTTLAVLAGLLRPERGRVALAGEALLDLSRDLDRAPEERAVGLVAQDGLLFPHLSVAGNLRYAERRRRGRPAPARDAVVETLRLAPLLDRRPGSLSGGESQRVALARALLAGPRLLLLDEPVSALDEAARREVLGFVVETVGRFRVPTLFVSHQVEEVLRVAATVARMEAGRVVAAGDAGEVLGRLPSGAGVSNLLRVVYEGDGEGARGPRGALLQLPVAGSPGESVWCRLPSGAIALEPVDAPAVSSARNRLRGTVAAAWPEARAVRVAVDVGAVLQADLTAESARRLGIAPGAPVCCVFKTHSLEVLR